VVVDGHVHLEEELPVEALLKTMDAGGVDRAVLLAAAQAPLPRMPRRLAFFRACLDVQAIRMPAYRIASRMRPKHFERPDNQPVFDAAREHPDRFLPFAFLNPALGQEAQDELDRRLPEGARGVKLHLWFHGYRLSDAVPVLRRAEREGLPVLAHLGLGPPEDVEHVLDTCPKLKLILAHAGIPHFDRLWRVDSPRLLFDIAGPLVPERMPARLLRAVGPERVVYGSDAPIGVRLPNGHGYELPSLPDRAMGENLASLLA